MKYFLLDLNEVIEKKRLDFDFFNPSQVVLTNNMVKGYTKEKLGNVCLEIKTGKTAKRNSYPSSGVRILKVKNITGNGIRWNEHFFVSEEFYESAKRKSKVNIGDVLMLCSAHNKSYIGRCDIIDSFPEEVVNDNTRCCCVGELIIIRANPEKILPDYLLAFLRLPIVQEQIRLSVKGQSAHLYPRDLRNLDIVIPPVEVQKLIADLNIRSQEHYASVIEQAKANLAESRKKISNLILNGK